LIIVFLFIGGHTCPHDSFAKILWWAEQIPVLPALKRQIAFALFWAMVIGLENLVM